MSELTVDVVKRYRDELVNQGLKPATVNRKLVFLKRYAKWSTERGIITEVMHHSIKRVKPVAQAPRQPRGLSELGSSGFFVKLKCVHR